MHFSPQESSNFGRETLLVITRKEDLPETTKRPSLVGLFDLIRVRVGLSFGLRRDTLRYDLPLTNPIFRAKLTVLHPKAFSGTCCFHP
jgi:hypothetical protein